MVLYTFDYTESKASIMGDNSCRLIGAFVTSLGADIPGYQEGRRDSRAVREAAIIWAYENWEQILQFWRDTCQPTSEFKEDSIQIIITRGDCCGCHTRLTRVTSGALIEYICQGCHLVGRLVAVNTD